MDAFRQCELSPRQVRTPSTSLTMTHQLLPGMSVIAIGGEVDRTTSPHLADYIGRVHRPADHVVVDLTELSFLDNSGLLLAIDGAGPHLAAARCMPARLLQLTGVDTHLPVYATVDQAITAVLA